MKLIPEKSEDIFAINIAAKMSMEHGFCAMYIDKDGRCALIPPCDVYALSKKQQNKINKKILSLTKKKVK